MDHYSSEFHANVSEKEDNENLISFDLNMHRHSEKSRDQNQILRLFWSFQIRTYLLYFLEFKWNKDH